jgi:hypothetical protein
VLLTETCVLFWFVLYLYTEGKGYTGTILVLFLTETCVCVCFCSFFFPIDLDLLKVLGVQSVAGAPLGNGLYRMTVVFDRGAAEELLPVDAAGCADAAQGIVAFQPGTHVTIPDTAELHFRYFIGAADAAEYLTVDPNRREIVLADAVADTIVRSTNNLVTQAASLALPSLYIHLLQTSTPPPPPPPLLLPLLPTHLIGIDTATQPTVVDVYSTLASGTYYPGDAIPVVVKFDRAVWVWVGSALKRVSSDKPVLWMRAGQYALGGGVLPVTRFP